MDKKYEVVLLPARSMYYTGLYLGCAYALQVSGSWLITMLVWAGTLAFYLVDRHARGICMDIWWLAAIKVVIYSTIVVGGTIFIYFSPSAEHLIYKNIMNAGGLIAELILNLYVFRVVTFEKYGWTELKGQMQVDNLIEESDDDGNVVREYIYLGNYRIAMAAQPLRGKGNYFRDYDPSLGRYAQSDPIGLLGGPTQFSYVGNKTDHSG